MNKLNVKEDIIKYSNTCSNCFASILNEKNEIEVLSVKHKYVLDNMILLGIEKEKAKYLKATPEIKISIAIWQKIRGYQYKGKVISDFEAKNYSEYVEQFKNILLNNKVNISAINIVICKIDFLYHLTPGKFAGELV